MNLPDRVNLDLRQRERDNDEAEEYFAMNRDSMIEEEVYRLEKSFDLDDMRAAIASASAKNLVELFQGLQQYGDQPTANQCLWALRDIRDAWIKQKATDTIENQ